MGVVFCEVMFYFALAYHNKTISYMGKESKLTQSTIMECMVWNGIKLNIK